MCPSLHNTRKVALIVKCLNWRAGTDPNNVQGSDLSSSSEKLDIDSTTLVETQSIALIICQRQARKLFAA